MFKTLVKPILLIRTNPRMFESVQKATQEMPVKKDYHVFAVQDPDVKDVKFEVFNVGKQPKTTIEDLRKIIFENQQKVVYKEKPLKIKKPVRATNPAKNDPSARKK